MASHRVERVRELLKRALGEAIRREIPVDEAGLITVNDVDIGGDLRNAKVFISVLGNAEQQRSGLALLQKNRVRIQGLVAKSVILKYTPQLRFVVDDSVVRGDRVLRLLEELEQTPTGEA
jgi:ribosome-binding factor A